jgi:glycerol-3-phosphate cytidylyltransferase-like family protein
LKTVIVAGSFDEPGPDVLQTLEAAAGLGRLRALLWPDETVAALTGAPPRHPEMERLRRLRDALPAGEAEIGPPLRSAHVLPDVGPPGNVIWAVFPEDDHPEKRAFCAALGIEYRVLGKAGTGL